MDNIITGIDIGGTHITVSLVNTTTGALLRETLSRGHVDTSLAPPAILHSWASVIHEAHQKAGRPINKIGIAMPGPFDYEKGISYIKGLHKYESLYGLNVKNLIASELGIGIDNIKMTNDASAYLLGELKAGAGRDSENMVAITLGTGLGSATYHDKRIDDGDLYCFPFEGGTCEDYASARWLLFEYQKLSGTRLTNVKDLALLAANDAIAQSVFATFGKNLYRIIYNRYSGRMPELLVIGGNIARAWDLFMPSLIAEMERTGVAFEVKPAELGEEAALIGSSYLWKIN